MSHNLEEDFMGLSQNNENYDFTWASPVKSSLGLKLQGVILKLWRKSRKWKRMSQVPHTWRCAVKGAGDPCALYVSHESMHSERGEKLLNISFKWLEGKLAIEVQIQVSSAMKTIDEFLCIKIRLKCLCQAMSSHPPCVSSIPTPALRMSGKFYFKLSVWVISFLLKAVS